MRRYKYLLITLVLLLGLYSLWALTRPLPALPPVSTLSSTYTSSAVSIPWPADSEMAVGAAGYGTLASHGEQTPRPTASVAKVMTALAVLQKHPLRIGQQGPTLTLGQQDINYYNQYVAQDGSVVPVNMNEQISEYQALEAMLLPSGNNIADTLAVWSFGSVGSYTSYANNYAKKLSMTATHIADASGFSNATTSTASDLVQLGTAALANPVLAQIVGESTAAIPVAGTVHNIDSLLGQNGVNGIKTGNTDQAGGVFLGSATYTTGSHHVTAITAIMGAKDLPTALADTPGLLQTVEQNFTERTVVHGGDIVGYYNTPWHTSTNVVADSDFTTFGWRGSPPKLDLALKPIKAPTAAGQQVGTLNFTASDGTKQQTTVSLQQPVTTPSLGWRWLHP